MLIFVFLAKIQRPNTLNGYGWMKGEDSREKEGGMVTLSLFGFFFFFLVGGYHILPKLILLWSSGKLRLKRKEKNHFCNALKLRKFEGR